VTPHGYPDGPAKIGGEFLFYTLLFSCKVCLLVSIGQSLPPVATSIYKIRKMIYEVGFLGVDGCQWASGTREFCSTTRK
jgi:hypothetical protein